MRDLLAIDSIERKLSVSQMTRHVIVMGTLENWTLTGELCSLLPR